MPFGTKVGFGPGTQLPTKGAQPPPNFRPMSIVANSRPSQLLLSTCCKERKKIIRQVHCTVVGCQRRITRPNTSSIVRSQKDLPYSFNRKLIHSFLTIFALTETDRNHSTSSAKITKTLRCVHSALFTTATCTTDVTVFDVC